MIEFIFVLLFQFKEDVLQACMPFCWTMIHFFVIKILLGNSSKISSSKQPLHELIAKTEQFMKLCKTLSHSIKLCKMLSHSVIFQVSQIRACDV